MNLLAHSFIHKSIMTQSVRSLDRNNNVYIVWVWARMCVCSACVYMNNAVRVISRFLWAFHCSWLLYQMSLQNIPNLEHYWQTYCRTGIFRITLKKHAHQSHFISCRILPYGKWIMMTMMKVTTTTTTTTQRRRGKMFVHNSHIRYVR